MVERRQSLRNVARYDHFEVSRLHTIEIVQECQDQSTLAMADYGNRIAQLGTFNQKRECKVSAESSQTIDVKVEKVGKRLIECDRWPPAGFGTKLVGGSNHSRDIDGSKQLC